MCNFYVRQNWHRSWRRAGIQGLVEDTGKAGMWLDERGTQLSVQPSIKCTGMRDTPLQQAERYELFGGHLRN